MSPEAHNVAEALDRGCAQALPAENSIRIPWIWVWMILLALAGAGSAIAAALRDQRDGLFIPALTLGFLLLAAGYDAATGRIPNPLTYTAILIGLAINAAAWGLDRFGNAPIDWVGAVGPTQSFVGLLICGGIGILCMIGGGFGGGDMKVLASLGAMLGWRRSVDPLLFGLGVAAVYSLINLAIRGRLNRVMGIAATQLLTLVYLHRPAPLPAIATSASKIPLALPLVIGLLLSQVMSSGLLK